MNATIFTRTCRARLGAAAGALLLLTLAPASAHAADRLVIEAGRIVQNGTSEIRDGLILVENGRIKAIGKRGELETPWDAPVIGGPKLVAFPGFVEANTSRGLDRANENIDVAPFLDVRDSVDPVNFFFEDCLRWGVTTLNIQQGANCVVGGRGMIVRPVGMTVEEMTVRPDFGIKLSASAKSGKSPATQAMAMRRAFDELRAYLEKLVADERAGKDYARREALAQGRDLSGEAGKGRAMEGSAWKVDGLELVARGEISEKQTPLLELVEGKRPAFFHCNAAMDVRQALEVARANGFLARTTLILGSECFKAADLVAEAGVRVVLLPPLVHLERDPVSGKEIETFVPKVFADKGVRFALSSELSAANSLWFQAASAVGRGLERRQAIEAVTQTPAEILGLGERVGSLEVGKDANVLLLSGDPLSVTTFVEHVVIEGQQVYERSKDLRLKHLYEGREPVGTQPMNSEASEGDSKKSQKKDKDEGQDEAESEKDEAGKGGEKGSDKGGAKSARAAQERS